MTRLFSVALGITSLPFEEGRRSYGSLGLRSGLFGMFSRLDFSRDDKGNSAVQGSIQTSLFGVDLFVEHGEFFDFTSERILQQADPIESLSEVRFDGVIPAWILPRIAISLTGEIGRRESGKSISDLSNRLSMFTHGISASNNLNMRSQWGGDQPNDTQLDGSFLLSGRLQRLSLRGTLNYDIKPGKKLNSTSLTADYDFSKDFSTRVSLNQQLNGDEQTSVSGGLNHRFRMFAIGIDSTWRDDGNFTIGASLTFSLGVEPRSKKSLVTSDRLATSGAVSARVFLDNNQNSEFDAKDELLEGIEFRRGGEVQTDQNGVALVTQLGSHRQIDVVVDSRTLDDPFWILPTEGYSVVPRPGRTALIDFPVVPTGEVDGTIFLHSGESVKTVSNTQLQLMNSSEEVVQNVKSEFDGFYLFQLVPPGKYWVRISLEQIDRLSLKTPDPQEVVIDESETIRSGIDFFLEQLP